MTTFTIPRPGGFRLSAAAQFYESFTPGSGMAAAAGDQLTLAFRLDRTFEAVVAELGVDRTSIRVRFEGTRDEGAVEGQLARILGLYADGNAWLAVGTRDPVVGALQSEFSGFFTAAKSSPYDAATWAVIAPRMNHFQAAQIRVAMAETLGDRVALNGRVHHVFPSPRVLAELPRFPGLSDVKVARLRGIGEAALAGLLDADGLRAMGETAALTALQTLRGIGPWGASHIFYRGAAPEDALPTAEPRVLHGAANAYGLPAVSEEQFREMAEAWRPFRMWVCVLLSRHLARTGGWRAPTLVRERAAAGKALQRRLAVAV